MKSKIAALFILVTLLTGCSVSQAATPKSSTLQKKSYPHALVDYDDFKRLVTEVEKHRSERLVSLDTFLKMSKEKNVVILDTRSDVRFDRKHIKGAIHVSFTDFTEDNLRKLIPDPNTKILIYCNNNFDGDQIDFTSKVARTNVTLETELLVHRKPLMLALNIPTYINLFGYGYRNVYELDELVNVTDRRIVFEGTEVK